MSFASPSLNPLMNMNMNMNDYTKDVQFMRTRRSPVYQPVIPFEQIAHKEVLEQQLEH